MTRSLDQAVNGGADVSAMASANLLINGFHTVSQENGTSAVAVSMGKYATDQWQMAGTGASSGWAGTLQQVANPFPSRPDIPYGLKLNITTAAASLGGADNITIAQPLEGTNLARLMYGSANAKTVTLAFMIRPGLTITGSVGLMSGSSDTARSIMQTYTAAANTDTFIYLTIPGDTAQALTTTNAQGLAVRWCFGSVAQNSTSSAGTWLQGQFYAVTGTTNLAATVGNNVILSAAVMLPGIVPITQGMLPLLARQYDDEERKCWRYYWNQYSPYFSVSAGTGEIRYPSPVKMRVAPTVVGGVTNNAALDINAVSWRIYTTAAGGSAYFTALNARM